MKWKQYTVVILIITTLAIAYYFLIDKDSSVSNLPEQLSVSNHQKADDLHPEKLKLFNDEKKLHQQKTNFLQLMLEKLLSGCEKMADTLKMKEMIINIMMIKRWSH